MEHTAASETRYEFRGEGLEVTYAAGVLTLRDQEGERSFGGADLESAPISIGTLLTVTLEAIPDGDTTTLSVILPAVNFSADAPAAAVTAAAIRTRHAGSIGGPPLVEGPLETYSVVLLKGTARQTDGRRGAY